jgi:hypothetical protein
MSSYKQAMPKLVLDLSIHDYMRRDSPLLIVDYISGVDFQNMADFADIPAFLNGNCGQVSIFLMYEQDLIFSERHMFSYKTYKY